MEEGRWFVDLGLCAHDTPFVLERVICHHHNKLNILYQFLYIHRAGRVGNDHETKQQSASFSKELALVFAKVA